MGFLPTKKKADESGLTVDTNVESNVETSSSRVNGTGQVDKLVNKSGTVNVDNSSHVFNLNMILDEKDDAEKMRCVRKLKEEFERGEIQFVDERALGDLQSYNEFERGASSDTTELLNFFRDKISESDLQILKTGLYIRSLVEQQRFDDAKRVRLNAVRANSRAKNIINLVCEGYFEGYIRPIFEANPSDLTMAQEHYDEIVCYLPEMFFVHSEMNAGDIVNKVEEKIEQRVRYHVVHVRRIMVNGIGAQCVRSIMEAQLQISQKYPEYALSFSEPRSGGMKRARLEISLP